MRRQTLQRVMELSGVRRFTPETASLLSRAEIMNFGLGSFFGLSGDCPALVALVGWLLETLRLLKRPAAVARKLNSLLGFGDGPPRH